MPPSSPAKSHLYTQPKTVREMGPLLVMRSLAEATTLSHTRGTPTRMAGLSATMSSGTRSMLPCSQHPPAPGWRELSVVGLGQSQHQGQAGRHLHV